MDYGHALICCILNNGDLGEAIEMGVRESFFPEDRDKRVWRTMVGHFGHEGTTPTPDVIIDSYPSYELGAYPHPTKYYVKALASRRKQSIIMNAFQEGITAINEEGEDPGGEAMKILQEAMLQASIETSATKHVDYVHLLERRFAEWINGITVPSMAYNIPTLDLVTKGIRPEQFIVVTGLAKARKTWVVLHIASNIHMYGPVVFITFEMSHDELLERLACLWGHVPYDLVQGDKDALTLDHQRSLLRGLHARQQFETFMGVEDAAGHSTVTSLQALIKEVQPVLLVIDGVYFLQDERTGMQGYEDNKALSNISRSLKELARTTKVPILVTHQTLASKISKGRTSLFGMGYTSAFSQDANLIIGIEALEDQPTVGIVRILGNRSGTQGKSFQIAWDLDTGLVEEMAGPTTSADIPDEEEYEYGDLG